MNSAIYVGSVRHRRTVPVEHSFTYDLALFWLDLAELGSVFRWPGIFCLNRAGLFSFNRAHYFGDPSKDLAQCVRDEVQARTGSRPLGPIRLLTQISYFGFCFNPVSFYYCYSQDGSRVEAIVAEITNTPWKERHAYVLQCHGGERIEKFEFGKVFHVSPFMEMALKYRWLLSEPGSDLVVHMENFSRDEDKHFFDATLRLKRRELTPRSIVLTLFTHPLMTFKTVFLIHWQALRLWIKRVPVYTKGESL